MREASRLPASSKQGKERSVMAETLEIVGTVDSFEEKQGWHAVKVSVPGKTYPVVLKTKRFPLVDQAKALNGAPACFVYTESINPEKINPKSGMPYVNRYLEGVRPVAPGPFVASVEQIDSGDTFLPPPSAPTPPPPVASIPMPDKERWIVKQTVLKALGPYMAAVLPKEPSDAEITHVLRVGGRLEQWVFGTSGALISPPPLMEDDDIPF